MTSTIAMTLGDLTGVGPEVTLKALAAEWGVDETRYLLIGDEGHLHWLNEELGLNLPLQREGEAPGRICIARVGDSAEILPSAIPRSLPAGSPVAARAALAWLADGARLCLRGEADALVTAPVSKEAILRSGQPFVGQTEFLSALAGTDQTIMMLLGADDRGQCPRRAVGD